MAGGPITVLFTDLVSSTELLQRLGDEQAQRVFQAHHRLLRDAVAMHGGQEVKWTGDGLMATFASSADAVRCAVAMQQTTRGRAAGERLAIRAGLHVGEALREGSDWVGMAVVVARRLCDRSSAGQILCSGLLVELLGGRRAFRFGDVRALELKGVAAPVAAYEVHYDRDDPAAVLRHTPFTGRAAELARLERRLEEARVGRGGVAMLVGEPGIGKTRTLEEFVETARAQEALVLWGRCYEGEAARPYGPFAEALAEHVRRADPETLRADLGPGAAPLARLVPALKERLPDLSEPVPLQPDEELTRLIDASTQFLLAIASRTPMVLVLDDLHWADAGTVALLRHVASFAPRGRLLVVGAYRDVEVGREHPLADVLGVLPRETTYEQLALTGLAPDAVEEILEAVADHEVARQLVAALTRETSGNPFFIRAVLLHLLEQGALVRQDGRWRVAGSLEHLGLPETVRQVIERRLGRMSEGATRLLRVTAAFTGGIDFEVARRVAELGETPALDALDEALGAQLLESTGHTYDFTHALVRHTLYEGLSPARQVRLHRDIAEAMEAVYGERATEHAAAIARHYQRSASLPGAERGLPYCLGAAEQAERAAAFVDVADHLRAALDLLPATAPECARLLGRLGLALVRALRFEDAEAVARDAAARIAESESREAAGSYLAHVVTELKDSGGSSGFSRLVRSGLDYLGERHDAAWALLKHHDIIEHEASDAMGLGIPVDTPERREVAAIFESSAGLPDFVWYFVPWASRADIRSRRPFPEAHFTVGDYRQGVPTLRAAAKLFERQGRIGSALGVWTGLSRFLIALGEFVGAEEARRRAAMLAERLPGPSFRTTALVAVEDDWRLAMDEGWDTPGAVPMADLGQPDVSAQLRAATVAAFARAHARMGRVDPPVQLLATVLPAIEGAPSWALHYPRLVCDAAETLWLADRTDHIEVVERNLRAKVMAPDFRYPMMDGRLALARLCAPQGRQDEARDWFAKARTALDEQGARPLRAIVDYDEALMYARRGAAGDRERAQPLVDAALRQFRTLGMPGWIRRAEALLKSCAAGGTTVEGHSQ